MRCVRHCDAPSTRTREALKAPPLDTEARDSCSDAAAAMFVAAALESPQKTAVLLATAQPGHAGRVPLRLTSAADGSGAAAVVSACPVVVGTQPSRNATGPAAAVFAVKLLRASWTVPHAESAYITPPMPAAARLPLAAAPSKTTAATPAA